MSSELRRRHRMSLWGVGPTLVVTALVATAGVWWLHRVLDEAAHLHFLPPVLRYGTAAGLLAVGIPIWVAASVTVSGGWRRDILLTRGVYALCRNPLYGALLVYVAPAVALLAGSWPLLGVPVVVAAVFLVRVGREERYLRERFGSEWQDYRERTGVLVPRVWRLPQAWFYPVPTGLCHEDEALGIRVWAVREHFVNLFLVSDGEHTVAVDAGIGTRRLRAALRRVPVDPEAVEHVFLTHADWDHARGLRWFPRAQVHLGRAELPLARGEEPRSLGIIRNRPPNRPLSPLDDDEEVRVGTLCVRALASPGHTPGSTAYLVNERLLFTGDALVLRHGRVRPFYRIFNMDTLRDRSSVGRLARLRVDLLATGHTGCAKDLRRE